MGHHITWPDRAVPSEPEISRWAWTGRNPLYAPRLCALSILTCLGHGHDGHAAAGDGEPACALATAGASSRAFPG